MALYAQYRPNGHEQLTSGDATTVKIHTVPAGTKAFSVTVGTTKVYMTFDGTTPSSTNGLPLVPGGLPVTWEVGTSTIKWIGSAVATHTVDIAYLAG